MSAAPRRLPVLDAEGPTRPATRGDCVDGERPCPWVSCTHHLLLGRLQQGSGLVTLSEEQALALLDEMPESCALDVADQGGVTLDAVAAPWRFTRERARQIEAQALQRLPQRVEHLREDLAEEPEVTLRPAPGGAARPVEDRRQIAPPAQHAHLPGPDGVTEAAQGMWCPWMGAAMTAGLCAKRHAARTRGTARTAGDPNTSWPTYPSCAQCADGAAVAARVGAVGELVPLRVAVPARAIDWMGDGEAEPANDITEDTAVKTKAQRKEAPRVARVEGTDTSKAAGWTGVPCRFPGCTKASAPYREALDPALRPLCAQHRTRAQSIRTVRKLGAAEAVAVLLAGAGKRSAPESVPHGSPDDTAPALIAEQQAQIADLSRLLAESQAREQALRADRDALVRERAVRADVASPWLRLRQLAAVLVLRRVLDDLRPLDGGVR